MDWPVIHAGEFLSGSRTLNPARILSRYNSPSRYTPIGIALWRSVPGQAKPGIYRVNTHQELYSNDRLIASVPSHV